MKIKTLQELERDKILEVLISTEWNIEKSADLLDIAIPLLKRKIKKYNLDKSVFGLENY